MARAWREQPRACFESPSSTAHAPGAAFQVPCTTHSAAKNYMSRMTAISPHHPAISTRRRGRGAGRFHTRSKRPATTRGECDGRLLCSGPARHAHALVSQGDARTSARARVRTSHARAAAAASTRRGFSAVNLSAAAKQHNRHAHAGAAGATGQPARGRHAPRCAAADARSVGRGSGLAALPRPSQCRPEKGPV